MKTIYNGYDFSGIGEVTIKQRREYEGDDAPQRAKVTIDIGVDIFARTFTENYAALLEATRALSVPNGILQWQNEDTGEDYVNQTATIVSSNAPDEWSQYHTRLDASFFYYEAMDTGAQNLPLTFTLDGGGALKFSNVMRWADGATAERFDSKRKHRRETRGRIAVSGAIYGDTTLPLEQRRASFAGMADKFRKAMNSAQGRLTFGDGENVIFDNKKVRIEEFSADIDQAICAIRYSFTAEYILFPDESDYATAEVTAEEKDDFTGEVHLNIAGKVQASDEATARVKMNALIALMLKQYGYTAGQQIELTTTPNLIDADDDGQTFTELNFNGQWRRWKETNQLATFQKKGSTTKVPFGNVRLWDRGYRAERFDIMRSQRKNAVGIITGSGTWAANPGQAVADRRKALLAMQRTMMTEINSAEGTLIYGDETLTVRIEEFSAKVNQAETGIEWSFTAHYVLFPGNPYTTVEMTAEEKDDFTGEVLLNVSGKIQATDEAVARTKLSAVLVQTLKQYGYTAGQQLELTTTPNLISANADGDTFTELAFSAQYRRWKDTNQLATFQKKGSTTKVPFGNVRLWDRAVRHERFDVMRAHRRHSLGTITGSGTWAANPGQAVADRRAALLAMQRLMMDEVTGAEGALIYGDEKLTGVRIEEFSAKVNQAETGIDWSFTANYILFPKDTYATAEVTAEEKDDFTGEVSLLINGKIQAADEATGRAKLAAILQQILKQYGYLAGQQIELTTTPNLIDADDDGQTFTELNFNGQWRRWKETNQAAAFQRSGGPSAIPFGNVRLWEDGVRNERFDVMRSQRRNTLATISARGSWTANMGQSLADRRKALLAMQRAMRAEMAAAEGTLTYGDFKQIVRIEDFKAAINQAETGIDWSFTANYVLFPATPYATSEITMEEKDGMTGEKFLTISGKIQASDETTARAKLATVIAAMVKQYGYNPGQQMELDATANQISANADGDTFTELNFSTQWRKWKATNQVATFKRAGATATVPFGNVRLWDRGYRAERFDSMRSERRHATGMVNGAGTWATDPSQSLADRRKALLAMQRLMMTEINCADGTLTYGDEVLTVRIEEFTAHVNQAETGIDWSFTASYSIFPNEGGYATCEFTADTRDEVEAGDQFLVFAGAIEAPTGALARAKLNTLRNATLAIYGFAATAKTRGNAQTQNIDFNGDKTSTVSEGIETAGDANASFVRLTFNEEYRRRLPGSILSSQFTVSNRDDTTSGLLMTTYSGTITATGASADVAMAAAILRAQALGANKEALIDPSAFLKSQSLTFERRQVTLDNPEEFLRLTFNYEYQSKMFAGRSYVEMNTQATSDAFGPDSDNVSGFIIARDFATATGIYQAQVKAAYAGRLIRNESVTQSQLLAEKNSGYVAQSLRLDFTFVAHRDKPAGQVTMRYGISVTRDFRTLCKRSELSGDIFALNRAAADGFLNTLLAGFSLGANMSSRRDEEREVTPEADVLVRLHFEEQYEDKLTGIAGVIEMRITESVTYSGTRWSPQPVPFDANGGGGITIVQPTGIEAGSRTVRGMVTSGTLATAEAWARRQRSFLTGDADGNFFSQPEQIERGYEFVPRVDGIAQGDEANVQIYKVDFTFGEILPNYPAP